MVYDVMSRRIVLRLRLGHGVVVCIDLDRGIVYLMTSKIVMMLC